MSDQPQVLTRAFAATIDDVSKPRRTVTAKINTSGVDRFRTVILPAGGDFKRFMQTPAVLWEHGQDPTRGRQPIGHCTSIKYRRGDDDILAVTQFKADPYSDAILGDYADGTLTSFSVDFLPDPASSSRPTPEEVRARPDWARAECLYRKWELTGYSAVSYPGNPEALALAVERGLWVPDEVRRSLPQRSMAEGAGTTGGYTTKCVEGRYIVSDAGGAVVGEFDSEDEARAFCEGRRDGERGAPAPAPDAPPALPAGVRTYTLDEMTAHLARSIVDPLLAMTEQSIRDAFDLARGKI